MDPVDSPKLSRKQIAKLCKELLEPYRVTDGKGFKLEKHKADHIGPFAKKNKDLVLEKFEIGVHYLASLQDILYANGNHCLLVVLQAMDAAGKDGIIKHVMSEVNPQGCSVTSFKQPTAEEHKHDYLWRCSKKLPERGMIGIFNRSYYEEVLSVRVHPEWLSSEGIDPRKINKKFWQHRFDSINSFERHLSRNNTQIVKIFLHVSKEEQAKRLLSRLDVPEKNWKFSAADVHERRSWDEYQHAFEEMIKHTSSETAPWYVVPADHKWFARIVVLCAIMENLISFPERGYPKVTKEQLKAFVELRAELEKTC